MFSPLFCQATSCNISANNSQIHLGTSNQKTLVTGQIAGSACGGVYNHGSFFMSNTLVNIHTNYNLVSGSANYQFAGSVIGQAQNGLITMQNSSFRGSLSFQNSVSGIQNKYVGAVGLMNSKINMSQCSLQHNITVGYS